MKKFLLSLSALFIFSNTSAVDYNSIYLSGEATEQLRSIEHLITQTPLTQRIEEELAGGGNYWINPFRNIQRSLRSIPDNQNTPHKTIERLNKFMDTALYELNTRGTIRVYGQSERIMGYFLRQKPFYWGGIK